MESITQSILKRSGEKHRENDTYAARSFICIGQACIAYDLKRFIRIKRKMVMTERNSMAAGNATDAWGVIKKDTLLLEAVCCYLESEGILDEMGKTFFKKMWFCKARQEETERTKKK